MKKMSIDVRAFYHNQDIPEPKKTSGEFVRLLHPSKYPRLDLPRDRRGLSPLLWPLDHFLDSIQCYVDYCSTPDSGIDLNEHEIVSLAPGPDTIYVAGKHQLRRDGEEEDGDIPLGENFWLD